MRLPCSRSVITPDCDILDLHEGGGPVTAPRDVQQAAAHTRENIGRALVGLDQTIDLLFAALMAGGHVLLEEVPGTRPPGLLATGGIGAWALIVTRVLLGTRLGIALLRPLTIVAAVATVLRVARFTLYPFLPQKDASAGFGGTATEFGSVWGGARRYVASYPPRGGAGMASGRVKAGRDDAVESAHSAARAWPTGGPWSTAARPFGCDRSRPLGGTCGPA